MVSLTVIGSGCTGLGGRCWRPMPDRVTLAGIFWIVVNRCSMYGFGYGGNSGLIMVKWAVGDILCGLG